MDYVRPFVLVDVFLASPLFMEPLPGTPGPVTTTQRPVTGSPGSVPDPGANPGNPVAELPRPTGAEVASSIRGFYDCCLFAHGCCSATVMLGNVYQPCEFSEAFRVG